MKIESYKIEEFIKSISNQIYKNIKCFLIFGEDIGLVNIRKNEILEKILPDYKKSLSLIKINSSNLKEKDNILENEYNSFSLFTQDKKVILVEDAENSIVKNLENINFNNDNDNIIIITADNLDSKSSLKKFAEYNQYSVSIACYKDDINTIIQIINNKLKSNKFNYNNDVVKYLAEIFGGNRLIILNEIEKLIIYKGDDKNLTIEDIKISIQDNSEGNINEFINYFASLNFEKAFKELQNIYSEGIFPIVPIRMLISYFLKLQLSKYKLQNGMDFEILLKEENIFWKQKSSFLEHLKRLSNKNISEILFVLFKEECKIKGKQNY